MSAIVIRRPIGSSRAVAPVVLVVLALSGSIAGAAASPPGDVDVSGRVTASIAAPAARCHHPWVAPVDAPVTDPFRAPSGPYGPGNRGIEYGTQPGQDVFAIGGGVVAFAGPVAGRPVVVVDHGAGLRSSYVNLVERTVSRGQQVTRGQRIARADVGFHLGVRQDGQYIDPAPMLGQLCEIVRLVTFPGS